MANVKLREYGNQSSGFKMSEDYTTERVTTNF